LIFNTKEIVLSWFTVNWNKPNHGELFMETRDIPRDELKKIIEEADTKEYVPEEGTLAKLRA